MRLLLSAVLLAAAPVSAEPVDRVCRYHEDVARVPRDACRAHDASLSEAARSQAEQRSRPRQEAVQALIALLRRDPPPRPEIALALARLDPPLNAGTIPAWLEGPPLPPAALAAVAALAPPSDGQRRRLELAAELSRVGPADARLADGAAGGRAMDGSLERPAGEDPFAVPAGPGRGRDAAERPLLTPPLPRRSDLGIAVPGPVVAPEAKPLKVPPVVAPGRPASESLLRSVDTKRDPCADFFQYACGAWLRENPLRGSASNGRFEQLYWRNLGDLRVRVEDLRRAAPGENPPDQQRLGDYYQACTDEKAIERLGTRSLEADLRAIREAGSLEALADAIAASHRAGVRGPFSLRARQDARRTQEMIASVGTGGLGMPRDFFVQKEKADMREAYRSHVARMFRHLGEPRPAARAASLAVLRIEGALSTAAQDMEQSRDPASRYNRMPVSGLEGLAPSFPWKRYFAAMGAPRFEEVNVTEPEYLRALETLLDEATLEEWRSYLAWRVIDANAQQLPAEFRRESESFQNKLWGGKGESKRGDRCLQEMDDSMPHAMGQAFTDLRFSPRARAAMEQLAGALRTAVTDLLRGADWMTPQTREQALAKAAAMGLKIGSPEPPERYDGLHITRNDAYGNRRRSAELSVRRELARIGAPRDRDRWLAPAHTVNAFYDPQNNEIVFPAGILQPPFFDVEGSPAVNFGAIGAIIGHEIVHGFDDEGCKHDAHGNLRDWWTPQDREAYMARAGAFVRQYSEQPLEPGGTARVNGRVSLGENIADNGGLRAAYNAYMSRPDADRHGQDGFTPEQSFFLGFARVWCGQTSSAALAVRAAVSPHAPNNVRVNMTVSNMPEFRQAFRCSEDAPMVNPAPARLW